MENASVAFDIKTLAPTYELRIGMPGSSNALKIAGRLGLPGDIGESARNYLNPEVLEMADLISTVEEMQRELEEQQRLVEEKARSASKAQQEHEQLARQLKSRRKQLEREALQEASYIVQSARRLVENTIAEIKKEKASAESIHYARQTLAKAREEITTAIEAASQAESTEGESHEEMRTPARNELKTGDEVYIKSLRCSGTLISLPDGKDIVRVRAGNARINVPLSEIKLTSKPSPEAVPVTVNSHYPKKYDVPNTLNLQGYRTSEALDKADKYLDDAALAGLESVSIIHGKGTGALRDAVANLLSQHPHVASFRLDSPGVTVVELR